MKNYLKTMISQQQQLISQQASLIEINKQLLAEVMAFVPRDEPKPAIPTRPTGPDKLYNRNEAAAFLLVDPRTVTRYRINGKLRFVLNEDNRIRYREEDLNDCYFWKWGKRP